MQRSRGPSTCLVPPSNRDTGGAIHYLAYFAAPVAPADDLARRVAAFAREVGAAATLVEDGRPWIGMEACLEIWPLTEAEVARFRAEFAPARDAEIPFL